MEQERSVEEEVDELELLTRPGREEDLRTFLLLLHPADVAELLHDVDQKTALAILRHLDPERAGELLSALPPEDQDRILSIIRPEELAPIVTEMDTDDAADLIQELDEKTARAVLATLPKEEREEVAELLKYDPSSAGGIMQAELAAVLISCSVAEAIERVRDRAKAIENIMSVFVIDHAGRYVGNVALQDLIFAPPEARVEAVMAPKVVSLTPEVDQEEVARIFDRYSLVELPVVDSEGMLLGRITADDVHEVLVEEAGEDMMKMAGAGELEVLYTDKVFKIAATRMPWLVSTFVAELFATAILQHAQVAFGRAIVLLTFVPVITGMSGNVGTQSATIMIRGLAVGRIHPKDVMREVLKDLRVGLIMGITVGVLIAAIVGLWNQSAGLGLCVGLSLAASMTTASILGAIEPPILRLFNVDPAVASGPLITSINDITGIVIYSLIAVAFLGYLN